MDWIKPALDALSSVRTVLGLLAFLAILFVIAIQLTDAARRRSLVERIGGPSVIGEAALVRLLREYKDEKERTRALMAVLRHSRAITEASLEKVVADISGEGAVLRSFQQARITLGVVAITLILLAVIGYVHNASSRASTDAPDLNRPPATVTEKAESTEISLPPAGQDRGYAVTDRTTPQVKTDSSLERRTPYIENNSGLGEARIFLTANSTVHLRLVSQNVLHDEVRFTPYYISTDRIPILALRLYRASHNSVRTGIPASAEENDAMMAIWADDARGIAQMLCARLPTEYEWINAVVAKVISPGNEKELIQRGPGDLTQIQVGDPRDNTAYDTGGIPVGLTLWPEDLAIQRGLGPPQGYIRLVAPANESSRSCQP